MSLKAAAIWAGVSAGLMVIGAIGPWATVFGGAISAAGTSGDGMVVLIAGLVVGAMAALRLDRRRGGWTLVVGLIAALIAAAASIYDATNIQSQISGSHGLVSVGWGLWVSCIASVSAIVALVAMWRLSSAMVAPSDAPAPPLTPSR